MYVSPRLLAPHPRPIELEQTASSLALLETLPFVHLVGAQELSIYIFIYHLQTNSTSSSAAYAAVVYLLGAMFYTTTCNVSDSTILQPMQCKSTKLLLTTCSWLYVDLHGTPTIFMAEAIASVPSRPKLSYLPKSPAAQQQRLCSACTTR